MIICLETRRGSTFEIDARQKILRQGRGKATIARPRQGKARTCQGRDETEAAEILPRGITTAEQRHVTSSHVSAAQIPQHSRFVSRLSRHISEVYAPIAIKFRRLVQNQQYY
jgi:hypothetical protein